MTRRGGAAVDIRDLGIIPRILLATDGAITHILEAVAGEPVDMVRLRSSVAPDPRELADLGMGEGERALRRRSVLRGRQSGCVLVHADSTVVLGRLPEQVAEEYLTAEHGLLPLLSQRRIGTFRESIGEWEGTDEVIASHFGIGPGEILVARTYQIVVGGRPVAWITESFPKHGLLNPRPMSHSDGPMSGSRRIGTTT